MGIKWRVCTCRSIALSLCLILSGQVVAQSNEIDSDKWDHSLKIYLWGASIGGTTARGTGIDVGFDKLLDNLEFGFMAGYEARKGKWGFLVDGLYLDVEGGHTLDLVPPIGGDIINVTTDVNLKLKGKVFNFGGMYNFYQNDRSQANVVFGGRYLDLSSEIDLTFDLGDLPILPPSLNIPLSGHSLDAIVGIKGNINLSDRWFLLYYGDIGTGDSDLTWQAMGGISYRAARWADIVLTYRYLEWDLGTDVVDDLNFSGPLLGVMFRF